MPNEPKDNAEAMLKAYAGRRRAEAGPPIEPHPVTRRLLHDEIARTFPAPEPGDRASWRSLISGLIPRFSVAAGITGALALAVYLVHRENSGSFKMAGNEPFTTSLREARADRPLSSEQYKDLKEAVPGDKTRELADNALARGEPEKQKRLELAAAGTDRAKATEQERIAGIVTAPESDAKKMAAPAPASAEPQGLAKSKAEAVVTPADSEAKIAAAPMRTNAAVTSLGGVAPLPAAAPASSTSTPAAVDALAQVGEMRRDKAAAAKTPAPLALTAKTSPEGLGAPAATLQATTQNFYFRETTGELRQNFSQVTQRSQYRTNFNSPKPSPVLNNFQVERFGNRVQVTDADGSIYVGAVVPTDAGVVQAAAGPKPSAKFEFSARAAKPAAVNKSQSNPAPELPAVEQNVSADSSQANFAFRVAGTNRTVKKVVVFDGMLNVDSSPGVAGQQTQQTPQLRGAAQAANQAQNAANAMQNSQNRFITNQTGVIQNGRLSGQAVVGGREKLPIDAVPAAW